MNRQTDPEEFADIGHEAQTLAPGQVRNTINPIDGYSIMVSDYNGAQRLESSDRKLSPITLGNQVSFRQDMSFRNISIPKWAPLDVIKLRPVGETDNKNLIVGLIFTDNQGKRHSFWARPRLLEPFKYKDERATRIGQRISDRIQALTPPPEEKD